MQGPCQSKEATWETHGHRLLSKRQIQFDRAGLFGRCGRQVDSPPMVSACQSQETVCHLTWQRGLRVPSADFKSGSVSWIAWMCRTSSQVSLKVEEGSKGRLQGCRARAQPTAAGLEDGGRGPHGERQDRNYPSRVSRRERSPAHSLISTQ